MQEVFKLVGRVARSDAPVLIAGESGTGKELVAKAVHEYSPRRQKEMITINCGAIPENLLESELFGHEKGSFTGAIARRAGRFEQADGGTLFLDEIGDMPLSIQVKLLRVLQDGSFSRVGANETLTTDVRIIAATHKNLADEVAAGRFREDLYYRLNVVEIQIPAAARAAGGHPAAGRVFPPAHHPQERHGPHPDFRGSDHHAAIPPLAGQRPRAGKHHRPRLRPRLLADPAACRHPAGVRARKSPARFHRGLDQLINAAPSGEDLLDWLTARNRRPGPRTRGRRPQGGLEHAQPAARRLAQTARPQKVTCSTPSNIR